MMKKCSQGWNRGKKPYAIRARVFKALGNPNRLTIIDELQSGAKSVNELAELLGVTPATTSRHLSVLKDAGLVSTGERRGNMIFYRLDVSCIPDFMICAIEVVEKKKKELK